MALLETLQDTFDGTTLNPQWTPTTNVASLTVSGGTLNAFLGNDLNASAVATSVPTFQFVNTYVLLKVQHSTNTKAKVQVSLLPTGGGVETFQMFVQTGVLYMQVYNGSSYVFQTNVTYDPVAHAWWRIRHTGTTMYCETSPDGVTWTVRGSGTYTPVMAAYALELRSRWFGGAPGGSTTIQFDNVNVAPTPPATPTPTGDPETLGAPTLGQNTTATPTSISNVETFGAPTNTRPLETLQDDFEAPPLNPAKWSVATTGTAVTATVSGGTLNLNVGSGTTGAHTATVSSVDAFTFADSYLHAKVTPSNGTAATPLNGLKVLGVGNLEQFQMYKTGSTTTITCRIYDAVNTQAFTSNFTYNAPTMGWWRIRHTAGVIYFETAPADTGPWTAQQQSAYALATTGYRAAFNLDYNGVPNTVAAKFDYVNITPSVATPTSINDPQTVSAPTASLPLDRLQDDFTTGPLDTAKWSTTGIVGTTATVTGGVLNIDTAAGLTNPIGSVRSVAGYGFTGSGVFAKVVPDPTAAGQTTHLRVIPFAASNEVFYFIKTGANLGAFGCDTTGAVFNSATIPYDPVAHAWWKIRHTDGSIYWETSPDGITWTIRLQHVYTPQVEPYRARMYTQWTGTSTAGTVVFDNINIAPPYAAPTPAGDIETFGNPAAAAGAAATPNPIIDGETLDNPAAVLPATVTPDPITDGDTLGDPEAVLPPVDSTATPDPIADPEQFGDPETFFADADSHIPDSIEDYEDLQGPEATPTDDTLPDSIGDPETLGNPAAGSTATITPDPIGDPETLSPPTPIRNNNVVTPDSLADPGTLGDVQALITPYPAYYPDSIIDLGIVTRPDSLIFRGPSNWNYGEGIYSDGPYSGAEPQPQPPDPDQIDNLTYGTGTYSYGIYYGIQPAPLPDAPEPQPLLSPATGYGQPPLHILGIGPWSPTIVWRGLPNYFINAGKYPARPALALPPATSKGFTLRLAEGSEARIDLAMRRGEAIVIDEMDTDLWWRRKDPRTKQLEVIGRFNCAHIELSTSDTGVNLSAQFEDYVTVLGARMVLKYLNPGALPNPESQWGPDTPVTEILAFALPENTGLDLTDVTGPNPYPLGRTTLQYHLPPSTTIADVMQNLIAISPTAWEWWIETPADINKPPKLRFALGGRGTDKGVTLLDAGSGPTPIAAWTRNGAADDYANSLYYTGVGTGEGKDAGGGVVEVLDADIKQYGQRDALYGSSTQGGDINQIRAGAVRKLGKLADRKPTYTVTLAHGFWRGRNHIDVGDTVTLILRLGKDVTVTKYRVTEIAVNIDDNGMEDVTLTLGKPRASNDPRSSQSPIMRMLRTLKNYVAPTGAADIPIPED